MTDLIRFTYQGTTFRIKVPEVLNLSDYDFLKFLFYLVNQETRANVPETLYHICMTSDGEYMTMLSSGIINRDLIRFEKHLIWLRRMLIESQDPAKGFLKRPDVTNTCRKAYQEILRKSEEILLNRYNIIFIGYAGKTGFKGTAYTMLQMMNQGLMNEEVLNGLREQERRYCS